MQAALRQSDHLVDLIPPFFAGQTPEVQGATIAQLLAIFVAGHAPPLRSGARKFLIGCAEELVPIIIEEMIEDG
ncbi:hypothetical protein QA640_09265 [Bradyrhizobium sp. CB82]|uniref:hypothetical protein n=1 Tax=Bradyrhizobium sp. CB82 TaxID=3039159 RepID=UPI0024B0E3AC|nr:hypothetical protein [Bradyrhizobium sp. CB82]WFU42623.1 hypothetical protein QA640_09265 [Bradyrhizobium sp. CB82]